jgi:hypothetical protein
MSSPFAALAPLRAKLAARPRKPDPVTCRQTYYAQRREPDLDTLRVWNGNEFATLEQLVTAVPPAGGMDAYLADMTWRQVYYRGLVDGQGREKGA